MIRTCDNGHPPTRVVSGTPCRECERGRPSRQARGYDALHQRARAVLLTTLPTPCAYGCGTVLRSPREMVAAHRVDGDPSAGWVASCRSCNERAKRRGWGGIRGPPDPANTRDRPVGLVIVHHARKESTDDFLTSVSGTYGITGSVDTIVVVRRKRNEAFGTIHATGRDVADEEIPARFDELAWTAAPAVLAEGTFERSEIYRVIEERGPIFPKAIGDLLGLERTSVAHMVNTLVAKGAVVRAKGGYEVARVTVNDEMSLAPRVHHHHPKSEESEGGHPPAYAPAREDDRVLHLVPTDPSGWANPCHWYRDHQSKHRQTPSGWTCDACYPEEGPIA